MVYDRVHVDETSLIGIAVCLCLSCTRMRDGQEGVVLDLTETGTDTLGFCDVFDVVGVVPLETTDECLFGVCE